MTLVVWIFSVFVSSKHFSNLHFLSQSTCHTYPFIAVDDGAATLLTALRGAKAEAEAKKRAVAAAVNFILTIFLEEC
jgi:hypothetical protein